MDHEPNLERYWSPARETDPFSKRQRAALFLGIGGIIAALVLAFVTAAATPAAEASPRGCGPGPLASAEVRR